MSRLDDGFSTTIGFGLNANVKFYEKTVTPPGLEAGGSNDTTTMRNTTYRTFAPKKLITVSEAACNVAYDTGAYADILAMLGKNQLITVTFPDQSTYAFYGWIDSFTPAALQDGAQPTADVKIIPSNQDATGAETAPVRTAPPTA